MGCTAFGFVLIPLGFADLLFMGILGGLQELRFSWPSERSPIQSQHITVLIK